MDTEIGIALLCAMMVGYYVPMRYALAIAAMIKLVTTLVG